MTPGRMAINGRVAHLLFDALTWCIEPKNHSTLLEALEPIKYAKTHEEMCKEVMVFMFNASKWADK